MCCGFYGNNYGQPVCSTCHLFLFSVDINKEDGEGGVYTEVSRSLCLNYFLHSQRVSRSLCLNNLLHSNYIQSDTVIDTIFDVIVNMCVFVHVCKIIHMVIIHHHHHLSLNCQGRWGTTDDFATTFLHFSLFSTALWDLADSRPVHCLMLSSHLFLCLPCFLPRFTMPFKMVLARLNERET